MILVKRKRLAGSVLLAVIAVICAAFTLTGNDEFDFARREILLRRIGHEILLRSGDSTSRVLPVRKFAGNEYRISFENAFAFSPESLVNTTQRLLSKDPMTSDYVVNVLNCADASVAYGYAVSKNKKDDIISCIGRKQPVSCYMIDIKFKPIGLIIAKTGYLFGLLALLACIGAIFLRTAKPRQALPESQPAADSQGNDIFMLGSVSFNATARQLLANGTTIELTKTETRVLRMFASSPNDTIERSQLQKEIWEDEGVIVGRSLDMFISKLRKKLEVDPNIRIVVIRGKGYKLQING